MIRKTVPVLLILGLLASTTAFAADWPNFLGPTLDGKAPDVEINKDWGNNPPAELWRVSLTDAGYAGPSVADGKVFIIDHRGAEDVVRALALDTGDTVWEYAYPDPGGANNGFARATPCVDEGRVFVAGRAGQIVALNAEDGAEIWSRNIQQDFNGKRPQWNYTASPIVHGEKLIVVPGGPNAAVAALNKTTGETIWAGGGSFGPGYAQPAIATINGTEQYVCFMWEALAGVNAESGELLWQVPWETKYGVNAAVPIVEGNYVFATSDYGYGGGVYEITAAGAQQVGATSGLPACAMSEQ